MTPSVRIISTSATSAKALGRSGGDTQSIIEYGLSSIDLARLASGLDLGSNGECEQPCRGGQLPAFERSESL